MTLSLNLKLNFKRAGIGLALFLCGLLVGAESSADSQREVIDQAHSLILQKERLSALQLLNQSLKKTPGNKELLAALDEIANLFLSDKAQQIYELGISLKNTDLNAALVKMNEASRLEPDNQAVLVETARIQLASNDCSAALKTLLHAQEGNPSSEILALHQSQAELCAGQFAQLETLRPSDWRHSRWSGYWALLEIEHLFRANRQDAALALIAEFEGRGKTKAKTPVIPEFYYWQWKVLDQQKKSDETAANQYISDCHKLSPRQMREMGAEPHLCRRTPEVENFLKKSHNPEP